MFALRIIMRGCFQVAAILCFANAGLSISGENKWTTNGPYGARTFRIAIHPWDSNILYAATEDKGIFKSTDGGEHWENNNGGLSHIYALEIAFDPSNPERMWIASADGILKSTNGGETWSYTLEKGFQVFVAISPHDHNHVISGGGISIWVTHNGGQTWYFSHDFDFIGTESAAFHPLDPNVIYVGTDISPRTGNGGIYKTTNGGQNWIDITDGIDGLSSIWDIEIDPSQPDRIFICGPSGVGLEPYHTIYRSTDGGISWECVNVGMKSNFVYDLASDRFNPHVIYAATFDRGVWKSTDGGENWQPKNNGIKNINTLSVTCDEVTGAIYIGTYYGGIYKSTDGGESWREISQNITGAWIRSTALNPLNPDVLYVASEHTGLFKSTDGAESWRRLGDGTIPDTTAIYSLEVDPVDTNIVYLGTGEDVGRYGCGFFLSTDGGETWVNRSQGLPAADTNTIYDIAVYAYGESHRIYVAVSYAGVYLTENRGEEWTSRGNGITDDFVGRLVFDPTNPEIIYAGSMSGIFKTVDGGQHWVYKSYGLDTSRLSYFYPWIDPRNTQRLYATSAFNLYVSDDGGEHWVKMKRLRVSWYQPWCLAIDPEDSNHLLFGTFFAGVYESHDRGKSWHSLNEGFQEGWSNITTIDIDPLNPNRYYAGTGGFSFYTYTKTGTGIEEEELSSLPTAFSLLQNYPNPFNPTTHIRFTVPSTEQRGESEEQRAESAECALRTTLKIYNILGQEVRTLVDETTEAGYYTLTWDGRDDGGREVASGVYFYRLSVNGPNDSELLRTGRWSETKRMVLLR